jgi:hypothetical protein
MIGISLLQFQQEAVFRPSVNAAVFMIAPTHKDTLRVDAATQHHERKRLAAVSAIIHEIAQENQVTFLTDQAQSTIDESLVHEKRQHADKRLCTAMEVPHHSQVGIRLDRQLLNVVSFTSFDVSVAVKQ